jgi:hypothetical protein
MIKFFKNYILISIICYFTFYLTVFFSNFFIKNLYFVYFLSYFLAYILDYKLNLILFGTKSDIKIMVKYILIQFIIITISFFLIFFCKFYIDNVYLIFLFIQIFLLPVRYFFYKYVYCPTVKI